jgi:LCP family protein required for cell wall assembly
MPKTRWGVAWRGLLAFVIVVACAAGTTTTAGLLKFKDIGVKLGQSKALPSKGLVVPPPGAPQTLLLIGVDCRPGQCRGGGSGNTDTMMLVRINADSSTINALSIPRDLGVQVPGAGYEKVNAAYAAGGETLLIKTLKDDLFPALRVSHVLIVDFASFANLINAIGCVWAQPDRRYYNRNVGTSATFYAPIDIEPGYQKMCGGYGSNAGGPSSALAFVRFRHNDNDFVRQARQQDFLRWAKQNFSTGELLSKENELITDVGRDVQTDGNLRSTDALISLFDLAIHADGSALKSIPFPATGSTPGSSIITVSEADTERAYRQLISPTRQPASSSGPVSLNRGRGRGRGRSAGFRLPAYMAPDVADGRSQAAQLGSVGFPVYFPRDIPEDFTYCLGITGNCDIFGEPSSVYLKAYPRRYEIDATDGRRYPAYVMTLVYQSGGITRTGVGEYVGVEGTTWPGAGHAAGPPLLRRPSSIRVVNGRRLYLYSQGGHLTVVAWKTERAVYWISNTLQSSVPNNQMVAMAATFTLARG